AVYFYLVTTNADGLRSVFFNLGALLNAYATQDAEKIKAATEVIADGFSKFNFTLEQAREAVDAMLGPLRITVNKAMPDFSERTSKATDTINALLLKAAEVGGVFNQLPTGFATTAASVGLTDKAAASLSLTFAGLTAEQKKLAEAQAAANAAQEIYASLPAWQQLD